MHPRIHAETEMAEYKTSQQNAAHRLTEHHGQSYRHHDDYHRNDFSRYHGERCYSLVQRFKKEFKRDCGYWSSMERCHDSIGRTMYYTSITITLGFLILALSNFIPTIYFDLLTGFSMLVAMIANLTLSGTL